MGDRDAYKVSTELGYGQRWLGETPAFNTAQWDHAFDDGAMFKYGNMRQGIYVDPRRDFAAIYFGLATNDEAAWQCGYTDLSNFNRAFKGWTKQTPHNIKEVISRRE